MDEIAEEIELRQRAMRQAWLQLTPEQRIERANQLELQKLERFRRNPGAFERFLRRNLTRRAVSRPQYLMASEKA